LDFKIEQGPELGSLRNKNFSAVKESKKILRSHPVAKFDSADKDTDVADIGATIN